MNGQRLAKPKAGQIMLDRNKGVKTMVRTKIVKAKLFKVVGNRWGGKEVTLTFKTPTIAQQFQEAVAVDDLVSAPKRRAC